MALLRISTVLPPQKTFVPSVPLRFTMCNRLNLCATTLPLHTLLELERCPTVFPLVNIPGNPRVKITDLYPYPAIPVPKKDGSGFFRVRVPGLTVFANLLHFCISHSHLSYSLPIPHLPQPL